MKPLKTTKLAALSSAFAKKSNNQPHIFRRRLVMLSLSIIIAILAISNIVFSAHLSHLGLEIQEKGVAVNQLQKENTILELELLEKSSLASIETQASALGFTSDYQALALPLNESVAYNPF